MLSIIPSCAIRDKGLFLSLSRPKASLYLMESLSSLLPPVRTHSPLHPTVPRQLLLRHRCIHSQTTCLIPSKMLGLLISNQMDIMNMVLILSTHFPSMMWSRVMLLSLILPMTSHITIIAATRTIATPPSKLINSSSELFHV